jgi:hypothetical protein
MEGLQAALSPHLTSKIKEQPMIFRIISPKLIVSPRKLVPILFILSGLISSCTTAPSSTDIAEVITPTSPVVEITPAPTCVKGTAEIFSSDQLGLSFSFPLGYTQLPDIDTVQIAASDLADSDVKGRFWLEVSEADNRTAEEVANEAMKYEISSLVDRMDVTLGGEEALVLDGMAGQDLVRKVYIVHQETLYILTFSPTRSENTAANEQMEALYDAVTSSWAWYACSASE